MRRANLTPSTDGLLKEAAEWLTRHAASPTGGAPNQGASGGRNPGLRQVLWRGGKRSGSGAAESIRLDSDKVRRYARQRIHSPIEVPDARTRRLDELAERICEELGRPDAAPWAKAWLRNDAEGVKMRDSPSVESIAVAVAAAVLVIIVVLRYASSVRVRGRKYEVSEDFKVLQVIRREGGEAARVAGALVDRAKEPWRFRLEDALRQLAEADRRVLLAAIARKREDIGVEVVAPAPGTRFDSTQMQSESGVDDSSVWVVAEPPSPDGLGYRLRGRLWVKAVVEACTADWWCLVEADEACPIGQVVRGSPERYLALDARYARGWTTTAGFDAFSDLRAEFDERTIAAWRTRFRERLTRWYPEPHDQLPVVFGAAGEPYDPSRMKAVGSEPVAEARVVAVEERDGLPQEGFGCIGKPPLLYAVVRVEEV